MGILFLAFIFFSSAISANKVILFAMAPELLVGLRMAISSPILAGYLYLKDRKVFDWVMLKKLFATVVVIALFTTFFPSNLKAYALAHMPSYKMAYFGTIDPFVAALYSYFMFKERLKWRQWLGMAIGFSGMMLLLMGSSPLEEQLKAFSIFSYPELAAFFAIVISRLGWIQGQQLLKKEHITPIQFNVLTMAIGGILSLLIVFMRGTYGITSLSYSGLPLLKMQPLSALTPPYQLGFFLGYTILIGNILGYNLYAYALKRYSATFIALAGFIIPLLVQLLGWLLLGEQLSPIFFVACAVTFMGVAIFFYEESTSKRSRIN